ncbi:hypothetical protein LOK49_LG09G00980 [Camellia lanceoleosa]|uniref:Uncharacterized protein n=1 Tax=Camellia lanceoleosa TaxID=1840588 RepID=A0ACC0GKV3_9ERIC|nr:hypothetical protein LOK49_LG09G00980 [Camellia lanceoleosa]
MASLEDVDMRKYEYIFLIPSIILINAAISRFTENEGLLEGGVAILYAYMLLVLGFTRSVALILVIWQVESNNLKEPLGSCTRDCVPMLNLLHSLGVVLGKKRGMGQRPALGARAVARVSTAPLLLLNKFLVNQIKEIVMS